MNEVRLDSSPQSIAKPRLLHFISIHPQFIEAYRSFGTFRSAERQGLVEINAIDLRHYSIDDRGTVDDLPFGGGDGMVLRPEPLARAAEALPDNPILITTSPGGRPFTHIEARALALEVRPLAFFCGRFAGFDQRFLDRFQPLDYSIGDVVVAGGELPALLIADGLLRLVPGVLGHPDSAANDSFGCGFEGQLEHAIYTRPENFGGARVPEVLLSGNHRKIAEWRRASSHRRTKQLRPDLLRPDPLRPDPLRPDPLRPDPFLPEK